MRIHTTRGRVARVGGLGLLAALAAAVATACTTPAPSVEGGTAAPSASAPLPMAATASTDSPGSDGIHPLYPLDAGPPDPLAQRFCDAIYTLPAQRTAECCDGAPAGDGGSAPKPSPIAVAFGGQCVRVLTSALSSHAVDLAPTDVDACAAAIAKATVGCDWVTLTLTVPIPPACEGILAGQLAEKAPCRSSLECAAGLRCQGLSAIDVGTCGPPRPPGQECNLAIDSFATLTRQDHNASAHPECDGYCSGKRCTAALPEGGACKLDAPCGKNRCEGGKCTATPLPGPGEACTAQCAYGLRCLGGKCAAPKAEGEACQTGAECRGACAPATLADGGAGGMCEKTCTMQWKMPKPQPPKAPPPRPRR
jgi:hypothetical protein